MDLTQLRYFLCVVGQGSFTSASRVLDVAQPALSRQVRLLEVELRHSLLIRNGRGVTTTEAGKLLADHARRILYQVELAHEELGRMRGATSGHVTVGLPPSLSKLMAVPLTSEFRSRWPGASLSISDGLSVSMQEWLMNGRLDIALLYKPQPSPDINTIPVMEEELFLVGAASRKTQSLPITLKEVAALPLVIPRRPHEIRMLVETKMGEIGCKPNIVLEVDGVPAILDILADGVGYAILPMYAVAIYSKSDTFLFRRIIEPGLNSMLALATSARRPTTPTQEAVLKLIQEVCSFVLIPAIKQKLEQLVTDSDFVKDSPS
jgi:LysR family nitrogen assimilation transcriptional regulator